jgi:hypothetical protein
VTSTASERLVTAGAFLSRADLAALGLSRRAVDAAFRACPVVVLPGFSKPLIQATDFRALVDQNTYDGSRVR